jgi:glyoxylate reductase
MAEVFFTRPILEPGPTLITDAGHTIVGNREDRQMERDALLRGVAGHEAILCQLHDRIDAEFMDAAGPTLRVLSQYAVGYNNIDVAAAHERGITVCNTPGVLTDSTADIAWCLLLGAARRSAEGDRDMRTGAFVGWTPSYLLGADIARKTLAIIGAGRIGYATARRAMGWDMKILYVARSRHEDFEKDLGAQKVTLEEALAQADFVSLHVPLNNQTHHLIGAKELAQMKPIAILINTARGPVVDEVALVQALQTQKIAAAGLDVYEQEPKMAPGLAECERTLLMPHLGSATIETRAAMSRLAGQNIVAFLAGDEPPHTVKA